MRDILDLVRRWAAAEQQNDPGFHDGRFRLTLVAVRPADRWLLANVHIGQLPGAQR